MASVAEQMAGNISLGNFAKATELKKRLWFTLGALILFRFLSYVPMPGIDPTAMTSLFDTQKGGVLDFFNTFSGGSLSRASIIALGVMPYITASIVVQLGATLYGPWQQLKKEGETGRKKMNQYTRYLTVLLTSVQGYWIAVGLETLGATQGISAVVEPGLMFRVAATVSLVGGTLFLMWIGEQITSRGIGNGVSLIIMAGIVASPAGAHRAAVRRRPHGHDGSLARGGDRRAGGRPHPFHLLRRAGPASRSDPVSEAPDRARHDAAGAQPPADQDQHRGRHSADLRIVAAADAADHSPDGRRQEQSDNSGDWLITLSTYLQHGSPLYLFLYGAGIAFFCFFYAAVAVQQRGNGRESEAPRRLRPRHPPGQGDRDFISTTLISRITVIGAAYLVLICLIPEILFSQAGVPFYLGGTSLLIVVNVTMDTVAQIQSHLIAHQYGDLIKKAKLKTRPQALIGLRGPGC